MTPEVRCYYMKSVSNEGAKERKRQGHVIAPHPYQAQQYLESRSCSTTQEKTFCTLSHIIGASDFDCRNVPTKDRRFQWQEWHNMDPAVVARVDANNGNKLRTVHRPGRQYLLHWSPRVNSTLCRTQYFRVVVSGSNHSNSRLDLEEE